jgi:hypothetical protein
VLGPRSGPNIYFFKANNQHTLNKKESTKKVGDKNLTQQPHKKRIYNPNRVIQSPTGSNPVIEPNVKQSKTHQHNPASPTRDPKPNCKKKDV